MRHQKIELKLAIPLLLSVAMGICCVRNRPANGGGAQDPSGVPSDSRKIDRIATQRFYVAGLSSGGFMASQLGVAYSSLFSGVGIFAGGIYGCSQASAAIALECVQNAAILQASYFVQWTLNSAAMGLIDPTSGISRQKIFVYAGDRDNVVDPVQAVKTAEFYKQFSAESVELKTLPNAGHGMPTLNFGSVCGDSVAPWFANCGYDGAGEALKSMLPTRAAKGVARIENLSPFNQSTYTSSSSQMSRTGYVYLPQICRLDPRQCSVLVALHGCNQSTDSVGTDFAVHSGFNDWAESNKLMVIYPSVAKTTLNPYACWDWMGYTGLNFANRQAPQIQSIYRMVEKVSRAPDAL